MQASAYSAASTVSVGPRFLALLIDAVVFIVVYFVAIAVASGSNSAGLVAILIAFAVSIVYVPVMEKMYGGTLGKMALGIKVVKEDGSQLQWGDVIIRYLLRLIDGLFAGIVGAILIWSSPTRQRLGDRAARTLVVRKDAAPGSAMTASQF